MMFDNLKALGALSALMKNKDKLAESAQRVRLELEHTRVAGEAGGGLVRAVASGDLRLVSIDIAPTLGAGIAASENDRTMAHSLIAEAVNDALTKARAKAQEVVKREADALGLPDLSGELGASLGGLLR
ncbi:MAG: YbaB/EbfC family nucleoid-associated protein [Phycisphaeraceae bacterium]|nr:YbaB/EbfC family nucleoid-associated protein [Phycisphaeraceae bacterium]